MTVNPEHVRQGARLRSSSRPQSSACLGRSSLRHVLVTGLLVLAALALCSAPAQALSQRGHEFSGSFGESGEASPSMPSAIAVNESSGDVYVLEAENNRVMVYGPAPKHEFVEAWGYGVSNGEKKLETCTEKCDPGLAGFGKEGQLDDPVAIAVDNSNGPSHGDVYVAANRTWKKAEIFKFGAKGEFLGNLITKTEKEEEIQQVIQGVAVDGVGNVWVAREDEEEEFRLERYPDGGLGGRGSLEQEEFVIDEVEAPLSEWLNISEFGTEELMQLEDQLSEFEIDSLRRPLRPGFAVDSAGDFLLTYEPLGHDYEELKELKEEHKRPETLEEPCVVHHCFAEKLELSKSSPVEARTLLAKLDRENTTGIAADVASGEASNDILVDNGSSVAAFTSAGSLIQRFGAEQLKDGDGTGLAIDSATGEVLVADVDAAAKTGRIDAFVPEKEGAPVIEPGSPSFDHGRSTSVELRATIDPNGTGLNELHYYFQYGTGSCTSEPASCTQLAPELQAGESLQEGFGEQTVSVHLSSLSPSTTYHFRVIAESSLGKTISEESTFTTQASAVEASLLDGRAWELVSPAEKHGASILPLQKEGGLMQASESGRAVAYLANAPIGENEPLGYRGGPEPVEIFGKRSGTQWSAEDIATANGVPAQGLVLGGPWEYQFFTPELTSALLTPLSSVPPSSQTEPAEKTVYLRDMQTCPTAPEGCYLPVVSAANDTAKSAYGEGELFFEGATPDLSHVVISSKVGLTKGAPATGESLYEWSSKVPGEEQLQLISVLPSNSPAEGRLGAAKPEEAKAGAISENGSRIVWSGVDPVTGKSHIYMSELYEENGEAKRRTLQVDEPDTGASLIGADDPVYQAASPDGSKVFFTDSQRLTADSSGGPTPEQADLYVYEPGNAAGERVTDLSRDLIDGERAAVQGAVLGIGEKGSYVYFVANGVLASGVEPGDCRGEAPTAPRGTGCNLYVEHRGALGWEAPRFIARLSNQDNPDWGLNEASNKYVASHVSARVSPNGEYLAFMSNNSLTGYDNIDANSGYPDEEVYLYHYGAPKPVCASCNPSGERPVGVLDISYNGEGEGLVVDRPQAWVANSSFESYELNGDGSWLAGSLPGWTGAGEESYGALYQPRYLSNGGRLFFNSADALVPVAKPTRMERIDGKETEVGTENVYEYEPKATGSCHVENTEGGCVALISSGESEQESAFLDASNTGNDVFFVTNSKLVPQDPDLAYDIYDARVCKEGGAEPCPTPPPESSSSCGSEVECKPNGSAGTPGFEAPASATLNGSGNITAKSQTLAQKTEQKPAVKPKSPTRAQLLAKALSSCKKDKKKNKRLACEKQARKKYGSKSTGKKASARGSTASSAKARG